MCETRNEARESRDESGDVSHERHAGDRRGGGGDTRHGDRRGGGGGDRRGGGGGDRRGGGGGSGPNVQRYRVRGPGPREGNETWELVRTSSGAGGRSQSHN